MRSRTGVLLVATLTTLLAACADSASIAGTGSNCPCFPAATTPPVDHGAAMVYLAPDSLYGQLSRYLLYADGTFVLEIGGYTRTGTYVRTDSLITFAWGGASNGVGVWGATAVVRGDDMTVTYNLAMALSDFANGTYRLQRASS